MKKPFPLLLFFLLITAATWPHERRLKRAIHKLWPDMEVQWEEVKHPAFRQIIPEVQAPNASPKTPPSNALAGIPNRLYRLSHADSLLGWLLIRKAAACHLGGCFEGNAKQGIAYEEFTYALFLDTSRRIQRILVLDLESDYGYQISSKSWLRQMEGLRGCDLQYGQQPDAISGATVSAQSLVEDLRNVCYLLE